jgi:hypothetical protein
VDIECSPDKHFRKLEELAIYGVLTGEEHQSREISDVSGVGKFVLYCTLKSHTVSTLLLCSTGFESTDSSALSSSCAASLLRPFLSKCSAKSLRVRTLLGAVTMADLWTVGWDGKEIKRIKRLRSDCEAIAKRLQSDCKAIAKRLRSDCKAIVKRLRSDCEAIAKPI